MDLYYDGCYRGSYLLTEKNEVAQWRVEISDLEDANDDANEGNPAWEDPVIAQATNAHGNQYQYVTDARDPADVSGGYLLEYDLHANDDDISFDTFLSSFTIKSPEPPTQGEARYISELVDDAFRALIIGEERGAEPGRYFDLEAFVRMGCLQEFVMDGDYLSVSSSYFAVDQGAGRLVACAPWDFDRAFPQDSQGPKGFARSALMGNPSLQRRFAALWRDELAPLVDAVLLGDEQALGTRGKLHSIAYYQHQVDASRRMDETLWGLAPMSDEWLDFVVASREGKPHDYDIVIGAMADDQIYNYISDYVRGVISREQFWVLAKFKHPTHQIAFCTAAALNCITFKSDYDL